MAPEMHREQFNGKHGQTLSGDSDNCCQGFPYMNGLR
jgi:hypothetical protein